jgi:hypothetical protein
MTTTTPVYVRQSLLGSADKCLRAFQFDLENKDHPQAGSVARAIGTAYHGDKELFYNEFFNRTQIAHNSPHIFVAHAQALLLEEIGKVDPEQFQWSKNCQNADQALDILDVMSTAYYTGEHYWQEPYTLVGSEVLFGYSEPMEVRGVVVRGAMDRVFEDPSGWITIVDDKTAGKRWPHDKHNARKQNQPPFYIGVAQELWPNRPGYRFVFDIMTYKGEFERRQSHVTEAHVHATFEKAQQILALYNGMRSGGMDLPVNPSSNLCSEAYCDHWSYCSQGAVLN